MSEMIYGTMNPHVSEAVNFTTNHSVNEVKNRVQEIPATKRSVTNGGQLKQQKNLRVAAYCRVSTGDESQQTSYTTQKAFYTQMIERQPGWTVAGIYADEAISGTSRAKRVQFNQMIEDALNGKIDYIVTKSISRFARNTVDTLECVRQLRTLTPAVGIYFEKENIDTLDAKGELILTILSALAQDESRSISDNIRWSIQKNFKDGKPQVNLKRMIGYEKGPNGEWLIVPEQAEIVRYIFDRYLAGSSSRQIANALNAMGKFTINKKVWRPDSIMTVLRNEKYVGDLEMQKTITESFLSHKCVKNTGEAPRYYLTGHHAPIIDRETWEKVQEILNAGKRTAIGKDLRAGSMTKEQSLIRRGHSFYNLTCGDCGSKLRRVKMTDKATGYKDNRCGSVEGLEPGTYSESYTYDYHVWQCKSKIDHAKECTSERLYESAIEQSFMEMLYRLKRDYEKNGEQSNIARAFAEANATAATAEDRAMLEKLERLRMKYEELQKKCREYHGRQMAAVREEALEKSTDLQKAVASGTLKADGIMVDIENGFLAAEIDGQTWMEKLSMTAGTPAAEYGALVEELKIHMARIKSETQELEVKNTKKGMWRNNYTLFLEQIKKLPDKNAAGYRIQINGLDTDGSYLTTVDGSVRQGRLREVNKGNVLITPRIIEEAPDFLPFESGLYKAFVESGTMEKDRIIFYTNFGVDLACEGVRRTPTAFRGYRKCNEGGEVSYILHGYELSKNLIEYHRYVRKVKRTDNAV